LRAARLALFYKFDDEDFFACGRFLDRAIELDPSYAQAYAYKAWWFNLLIGESRSKDVDRNHPRAEESARRASELDPHDAFVLAVGAHIRAFVSGQPEAALEMFERSLHEDVNSAFAWGMSAATCSYLGRPEDALDRLRNVWRLSPFDPLNFVYHTNAGIAEFVAGDTKKLSAGCNAPDAKIQFFACRRMLQQPTAWRATRKKRGRWVKKCLRSIPRSGSENSLPDICCAVRTTSIDTLWPSARRLPE
jgi:tetratricopeptide (TPR) repeat protein